MDLKKEDTGHGQLTEKKMHTPETTVALYANYTSIKKDTS